MRKSFLKTFSSYVQPLKYSESRLYNLASYVSNLSKLKANKKSKEISIELWAKFDEIDFDGFSIFARLLKGDSKTESSSCLFTVYYIAQGNSWSKTLITSGSGSIVNDGYRIDIPSSSLPDSVGDYTFFIECEISRLGETYKKNGYFNHFYTLDVTTRLTNKVRFMEITKADE